MKWMSIVRFVPNAVRGEYINIAAIAGDDETYETEIRTVANLARAKKLDESRTIGAVMDFVGELQARAEDGLPRSEIEALSHAMRNIVQLTLPAPVVAHSLDGVLKIAFEEFILDPATEHLAYATRAKAKGTVRGAYNRGHIAFQQNSTVRSGPDATEFDFSVSNGKPLQLVRCWSFQLNDQGALSDEVRAWAWGVRALRQRSSELIAGGEVTAVPSDVAVEAVFIPPKDGQVSRFAYDVAQNAFGDSDVNVSLVEAKDAALIANRARQLLSASH